MTSPEDTTDSPLLARRTLTISITDLDIPEKEAKRQSLRASLEAACTVVLNDALDNPRADIESRFGHTYTTVSPVCPACESALTLSGIHLGESVAAYAVAHCSANCSWTGDAVFKLVDLDRSTNDHYESAVLTGESTPTYHRYADRDHDC